MGTWISTSTSSGARVVSKVSTRNSPIGIARRPRGLSATACAEIAHQRVRHNRAGVVERRIALANERRRFQAGFAHHRADNEGTVLLKQHIEVRHLLQIHHIGRAGKTKLHQRNKTLATGQNLRLAWISLEQANCLRHCRWREVLEFVWDHCHTPRYDESRHPSPPRVHQGAATQRRGRPQVSEQKPCSQTGLMRTFHCAVALVDPYIPHASMLATLFRWLPTRLVVQRHAHPPE